MTKAERQRLIAAWLNSGREYARCVHCTTRDRLYRLQPSEYSGALECRDVAMCERRIRLERAIRKLIA